MITKLLILLLTVVLTPTASANPAVNLDVQSLMSTYRLVLGLVQDPNMATALLALQSQGHRRC